MIIGKFVCRGLFVLKKKHIQIQKCVETGLDSEVFVLKNTQFFIHYKKVTTTSTQSNIKTNETN